jgi:hypothetical protein
MSLHRLLPRLPFDFVPRQAERIYRSFTTTVSTVDRLLVPVRVINFSQAGFLLECAAHLPDGEAVLLNLPVLGDVPGHIKWLADGKIGGVFDESVSTSVVMAALDQDDDQLTAAA